MSSKKGVPSWAFFLLGSLFALVLFAFGAASAWLYLHTSNIPVSIPVVASTSPPLLTDVFAEAWQVIEEDFYGDLPSPTVRTYGAIKGSIATLDDPYTFFIEPEPAGREQEELQGHFGGIGAYLVLHEDGRIHLNPMIGRPAAQAGVQDDDILLAVDGTMIDTPADLDKVTEMIRGPVGTVVQLLILRNEAQITIDVTRQQIELPSVSWRFLEQAPDTLYIRIERFSELTLDEFTEALSRAASEKDASALILDLRGNPGGLLKTALSVSDAFIADGLLLIERHADGTEQRYRASESTLLPGNLPVAVLIDGGTASAAEIVAGALKDHERAVLIGFKSYGKGSIQRIHRLSDQSAVHVTFARWFTPNDHQIDGVGLPPDVPLPENSENDEDLFITTALDYLSQSATLP
ncbi:MAG: S41 family peptidase [Chloroflexi bacterium]|nr:S41 family peptidase [Chloroflexota bacterium]